MLFEFLESLYPSIGNLAAFLRVEHLPLPGMKFFVKIEDEVVMDKVDEGIAYVGLILIVDRYIEEVILALMILVNLL